MTCEPGPLGTNPRPSPPCNPRMRSIHLNPYVDCLAGTFYPTDAENPKQPTTLGGTRMRPKTTTIDEEDLERKRHRDRNG